MGKNSIGLCCSKKMINALYKCLRKHLKMESVHTFQRIIINGSIRILTTILKLPFFFSIKLCCLRSSVTLNFVNVIFTRTVTNRISNGIYRANNNGEERKNEKQRMVNAILTVKCIIHDRFGSHIRLEQRGPIVRMYGEQYAKNEK